MPSGTTGSQGRKEGESFFSEESFRINESQSRNSRNTLSNSSRYSYQNFEFGPKSKYFNAADDSSNFATRGMISPWKRSLSLSLSLSLSSIHPPPFIFRHLISAYHLAPLFPHAGIPSDSRFPLFDFSIERSSYFLGSSLYCILLEEDLSFFLLDVSPRRRGEKKNDNLLLRNNRPISLSPSPSQKKKIIIK